MGGGDGLLSEMDQHLDPSSMKVVELKAELLSRGLPTAGKKAELAAALAAALGDGSDSEEEGGSASGGGAAAAAGASAAGDDEAEVDMDGLVDSAFAVFEQGLGAQGSQAMRLGGDVARPEGGAVSKEMIAQLDQAEVAEMMGRSALEGIERPSAELGAKRKKPAAPGFFDFRSTELTEEVRHDIEVIRMRNFINPKKHYKGQDHKWAPKEFQVGTVIVPAHEYYSAGMGRKELKRGALEGFKRDTKTGSYVKKKFLEVQEKKNSGGKKTYKKKMQNRRPKFARTTQ